MAILASLLNRTCTVQRPTVTHSASRAAVRTLATVSTGTACRLVPLTARSEQDKQAQIVGADMALFVQWGTDLRPQTISTESGKRDVVTVDTVAYEVLYVVNAAGQNHHLKAYMRRMQ